MRNYIVPGIGRKKMARLAARDIRAFLGQVARTCQCCALEKDKKWPERKQRCCAVGECCERYHSDRTARFLLVLLCTSWPYGWACDGAKCSAFGGRTWIFMTV
ncbi:hypothetical protein [Streptomyces sp. NPDC019890]|uniref:hypothetical protein n=1 Tax=Streptomyces sp. NPDC019890 TaxID=3365064 RepID=UPI00384EB493